MITFPDSSTKVITWADGDNSHYAISLNGTSIARTTLADYRVMLRYSEFDPLVSVPQVPVEFASRNATGERTYVVQFVTQPLEEYLKQLTEPWRSGTSMKLVPNGFHLFLTGDVLLT